ncbi:sensor histidine kinase [Nocardioides marmoribigeumensis]|uniref:Signal transduction histidine kinase n=1 Tax=Nocardioides marmoribigeumensis TaxID=433649 RepID=A0ABU2BPJ7_9ACTN|nr:histidine kinase [Nocardioides marmoribigeumensis]MDR7360549.1 signal transduction histidine kinase [Nocardioides marmoribigeumensis]
MTSLGRLGLTSRVFCLATILGLTLAFGEGQAIQGTLLLAVVGGAAIGCTRFTWLSPTWLCTFESTLAGIVIGLTLPNGALLLPYMAIPSLLVGVYAERRAVVVTSGMATAGMLITLVLGDAATTTRQGIEVSAPWVLASLGVGLLANWIYRLRGESTADEESYASARRLLSQLRTVTRRLSSGLDPVSISQQMLDGFEEELGAARSAVFILTEGGVMSPLAYRGHGAKDAIRSDSPLVEQAARTRRPAAGAQESGMATCRHRSALPLRLGDRLVGVAVADASEAPTEDLTARLMASFDELALRLDTALVWDELRSLATQEERQRLAREIHDGVAQELASLGYVVDDLAATATNDGQRTRLHGLRSEITRVVNELRLSIFDLRSEISTSGGLGSTLSDYVRAVGARSGMTVHLTLDEGPTRLRGDVEAELLRIAQEAITNARKHSRGGNLWVDCRIHPPTARITVQDDGGGLGAARPDSYGLMIMRERAERVGARLDIGEEVAETGDKGTRVSVTID